MFVSRNYAAKKWTAHERQSAQARALNELGPYLLPVRLDDAELPGLRPTVAYLDARSTSPDRLVAILQQKLGLQPVFDTQVRELELARATGFPRTAAERQRLINERPVGWVYTLWAAVMWAGKEHLQGKWYEHQLGVGRLPGLAYGGHQVDKFLDDQVFHGMQPLIKEFSRLIDANVQDRALGRLIDSADPVFIERYARHIVSTYDALLDWAARIRGAAVPPEWSLLIEKMARLADKPLDGVRQFFDEFVGLVSEIPRRVETGAPIKFHLTLALELDSDIIDAMMTEYEKLFLASQSSK